MLQRIIDNNIYTYRAAECTQGKNETQAMSVFELSHAQLSHVLPRFAICKNCDMEQQKRLVHTYEKTIYDAMQIQVTGNSPGIIPSRLGIYANMVLDLTAYPNLQKLFQREPRKQKLLSAILLCIRDRCLQIAPDFLPAYAMQCIITHQTIADKYRKRFKESISDDSIQRWIQQFHDLHLIHVCQEEEVVQHLRKGWSYKNQRPAVFQIPYYDQSVLQHADILAASYMPAMKPAPSSDDRYQTCLLILSVLLQTHGYFTRNLFIQCIRDEVTMGNADNFTEKNAATYFDKYIVQIQQDLHVIKSPCTKQLKARFGGNLKIGSTRLYYRNEV